MEQMDPELLKFLLSQGQLPANMNTQFGPVNSEVPQAPPQQPGFRERLQGLLGTGFDDPRTQGLLGLGSALLQASGPSTMPVSTGQALGQGLAAYTQGRQGAVNQGVKNRLYQAQTDAIDPQKRMKEIMLQENLRREREKEQWNRFLGLSGGMSGEGGGNLGGSGGPMKPGTSFKMTPRGPEVTIDPAVAANTRRDDWKARYEFGYPGDSPQQPTAAPRPAPAPQSAPQPAPQASDGFIPPDVTGLPPKVANEIVAKSRMDWNDYRNKMTQGLPKARSGIRDLNANLDQMISQVEKLMGHPGEYTGTGVTSWMGDLPATQARAFQSGVKSLQGKILLNVLASLKSMSATGSSGFGQLSNIEGDTIKNSIASLDFGNKPEVVKENLQTILDHAKKLKANANQTYLDEFGKFDKNIPDMVRTSSNVRVVDW